MVAVVIIGISATGILGGLAAVIGASGTHRSLTTLDAIVKSFAETARYDIQERSTAAGGPEFFPCATPSKYVLASAPYPSSGPAGTQVTVFGSGFQDGSTPSVTVDGVSASTLPSPVTNGDLNATFQLPPLPAGLATIQITDGSAMASAPFMVTTGPGSTDGAAPVSSLAEYRVGISGIEYWITGAGSSGFSPEQTACQRDNKNRADQVQQLTVTASAPGANDGLNFVVAEPRFVVPPTTLKVTNPLHAATGNTLTFTATLTPTEAPPPTGTITWQITGPDGPMACNPSQPEAIPPTPPLRVSCSVIGTVVGTYSAKATYSGDNIYAGTAATGPTLTVYQPTQLVFKSEPGGGPNGKAWNTQPVVLVEDQFGDVATSTDKVSLAIAPGSPAGKLTCDADPLVASDGKATFTGCQIAGPIGSYTLRATATDLIGGALQSDSESFSITVGQPAKLAFTTQPGGGKNGAPLSVQPAVTVDDSGGNPITGSTDTVNLAIASQPSGQTASLTCNGGPPSLAASGGIATFNDCQIVGPAGNYTLTATTTDPTGGPLQSDSDSFPITLGQPAQLVFTTQPGGGANGTDWGAQPVVKIEDSGGNIITGSTDTVALAIASQPSGQTASLTCNGGPPSLAASDGKATFSGCQIVGPIGSYTLTATTTDPAGPIKPGTSATFTITVGQPDKLVFTRQPGGGPNGAAWSVQPAVAVDDSGGNPITGSTDTVNLAIASHPPGQLATLNCDPAPAPTAGVTTFSGCQIVGPIGSYTLTATTTDPAGPIKPGTSATFTITVGQPDKLVFKRQPGGGPNGAAWSVQPAVAVKDSGGNTITGSTDTISLGLASTSATLACAGGSLVPATSGVASFTGCEITGPAGPYRITASDATDPTLSQATSVAFPIT